MSVRLVTALVAVLTLLAAAPADAQLRRGDDPSRRFAPPVLTLGAYGGWDTWFDEPLLGAKARLGIPSFSWVAVQATADWTFLQQITDRQFTADLLVDIGGFSVGGGWVFRNSVWDVQEPGGGDPVRETRTGASLLFSLGGVPLGRSAFSVGLDYRFIWIEDFRPRPLTVSVTFAPERLLF